MKNSLRITLAAVLILLGVLGYRANRPRPLTDCFPGGEWEKISRLSYFPEAGEVGGELEPDMTARQLKNAMQGITVFHRGKFSGFTCPNLDLHLRIGGTTYTVKVGENGSISIADRQDPDHSRTYWQDLDGELFRLLTGQKAAE